MTLTSALPCYALIKEAIAMIEILGIIVIIGTLVIAGQQGEHETGKISVILLCGFMLLYLLAEIKY